MALMAKSVEIPQDIIDSVIAAVGDDTRLLKKCSLVSSSFLLPSRKQLFSRITLRSEESCQGIHQFLVQNPVIQPYVRKIALKDLFDQHGGLYRPGNTKWVNGTSLLAILRLPFCRLECFLILHHSLLSWNWNSFSNELKDALSNIIHSSSLKTLSLAGITKLPITFFLNIVHLKTLELNFLSPVDFVDENSSSLTQAASMGVASRAVVDRCVWHLREEGLRGSSKSILLPFLCRIRFLNIHINHDSEDVREFDTLSLLLDSLCSSPTSPAILEHLELNILFFGSHNIFDDFTFDDLDVWGYLDSITTHPTGSRLQRVDININFYINDYDEMVGPPEDDVLNEVLDALPLLRTKGILFMKVDMGNCCAKYIPGITDRLG